MHSQYFESQQLNFKNFYINFSILSLIKHREKEISHFCPCKLVPVNYSRDTVPLNLQELQKEVAEFHLPDLEAEYTEEEGERLDEALER